MKKIDYSDIDFVIVGPPKAGTFWLAQCLREHYNIFVPTENNFLTHYREKGWEYWEKNYTARGNQTCIGDYSNWYFPFENIPHELSRLNPHLKIIICIRNPVARTISAYKHDLRWGTLGYHVKLLDSIKEDLFYFRYIHTGRYSIHIQRYLDYFPQNQIYLFSSPGEGKNHEKRIADLFVFLNEEPVSPPSLNKSLNISKSPLIPPLHRTTTFSDNKLLRYLSKTIDPINLYLGRNLLDKKVTDKDIEYLKKMFKVLGEKENLLEVKNRYNLPGDIYTDEWSF